MATAYVITHPDVVIDPSVVVTDWPLSSRGIERMRLMLDQLWVGGLRTIFSSGERKAIEAARIIADHLSLLPVVIDELGENDRSDQPAGGGGNVYSFDVSSRRLLREWHRIDDALP